MKNKPVRGFQHLIGETIKKIDAAAINYVMFETESGKTIIVHADEATTYGIPIVSCEEGKHDV